MSPIGTADRMGLRRFRYFVAVAEEKHFGRAAEILGIAQPGLSQQIKLLERALGVPLFTRDKRHVELTEAGEVFLDHARLAIEQADRAMESVRLNEFGKRGVLKVATPISGIQSAANTLLNEFRSRFPDVEIQFSPGFGPQNIEALRRRAVDVAIVFTPFEAAENHSYLRLGAIEPMIALPEEHRLASFKRIPRAELARETFLGWPRSFNAPVLDHLHRSVFGNAEILHPVEVADVMDASRLLLVAKGRGIAVSFPPATDLRIPGVVFRRVEDPPPLLEYGISWFPTNASPFVPAFVDLAEELVRGAAGKEKPKTANHS